MYSHIMVPLDFADRDSSAKALAVAADLARHYDARITLISVSGGINANVSHYVPEYRRQLTAFGDEMSQRETVPVECRVYDVPDPGVEVDRKLIDAISDISADLVVMATHQPSWIEYFVNSHAGRMAAHASVSVLVVRD